MPAPLVVCLAASMTLAGLQPARAHDGFLDAYGCHYNQATHHYHCHRGPLAGKQFKSQAHMREALQELDRQQQRYTARPSRRTR